MNFWRYFRDNILYPGCVIFSVCVFAFALLGTLGEARNIVPGLLYMFLLLVFSLLLAALNRLFYSSFSTPAQFALHFLGTAADFIVIFILAGGFYKNGAKSTMIIMLFFVLIYAVVISIYLGVRSLKRKRKIDSSEYKKQF
ncbi:MAG: DUF3021 family protein [Clostridiales bacterium]|nr:DUF3021 family protein [Clostridiales bacterium]